MKDRDWDSLLEYEPAREGFSVVDTGPKLDQKQLQREFLLKKYPLDETRVWQITTPLGGRPLKLVDGPYEKVVEYALDIAEFKHVLYQDVTWGTGGTQAEYYWGEIKPAVKREVIKL